MLHFWKKNLPFDDIQHNVQHGETGTLNWTHPEEAVGSWGTAPRDQIKACTLVKGTDWKITYCTCFHVGESQRKPTQAQREQSDYTQKGLARIQEGI